MADLIDRGSLYEQTAEWEAAAMKAAKKATNVEERKRWGVILQERTAFKCDVADAPSVDAVLVVRCKECMYKEKTQPRMVYCPNMVGGWVDEDWFCAGGRSEDE